MIMSKAAVLLALVAVGVSGLEVRKASGCAQAPEDPNVPPFPVTHKFPCGHPNITEVSTIGKFYRKVIEGHNQYTLDGAGGDADRTAEARDVKYPKQSSPCKPGADCGEAKDEVKHGQWTEGGIELPNYCKACTVFQSSKDIPSPYQWCAWGGRGGVKPWGRCELKVAGECINNGKAVRKPSNCPAPADVKAADMTKGGGEPVHKKTVFKKF